MINSQQRLAYMKLDFKEALIFNNSAFRCFFQRQIVVLRLAQHSRQKSKFSAKKYIRLELVKCCFIDASKIPRFPSND
jgi:hypothetical protein